MKATTVLLLVAAVGVAVVLVRRQAAPAASSGSGAGGWDVLAGLTKLGGAYFEKEEAEAEASKAEFDAWKGFINP